MFGKKNKDNLDKEVIKKEKEYDKELEKIEKSKEKEEKKEVRKEKTTKLKDGFNYYKFIVKIVAFVILVAFAITLFIQKDGAVFTMLFIAGGVSLFGAIIRLPFQLSKKKKKSAIIMSMIEIIIHLSIGAILLIGAFQYKSQTDNGEIVSGLAWLSDKYFPYFLSLLLYVRVVAYFFHIVIAGVETRKFTFWLHIFCATLAFVILTITGLSNGDMSATKFVYALAIIAIICSLVIGGEAVVGYINFNNGGKKTAVRTTKSDDKKKEDDYEINPSIIKDEIDDNDNSRVS